MDHQKQQLFFQEVLEGHKGLLFKVTHAYCPNEEDRQDLIQEIMIQLWQAVPNYNPQFKISTWLYRISLNVAISFYRKNSTRTSKFTTLDEQLAQRPFDEKSENEGHLILLEQFIDELREIDKALMLLYLEDKSHAEIADIMGMSVSNVGTKIGRIKEQLKRKFSQFKSCSNE